MAFLRSWYGILLVLLLAFVAGFLIGWAISGTTMAGLLSAGGVSAVVGAFVGFLVRLWLNKRDLTLAHRHRIVEDKAARLHEYIEQYYLPMCSSTERLQQCLDTVKSNSSPEQVELSFFRVMQWFGILKRWLQEKGGTIFLDDSTAEKVIKELLNRIQLCFTQGGYLDSTDLFRIVEKAQTNQPWSIFEQELADEPLKIVYDKYHQWIANADLQQCTNYLRCFYLLLGFGIDTALEPWYKRTTAKPVFESIDRQQIRNIVAELREEEDYKKKYLQKLRLSNN